jgi:hypothetical protein
MLNILSDPGHEEYESTREWVGEDFEPEHFDPKEIEFWDPEERWTMAFAGRGDFSDDGSQTSWGVADDYPGDDEDLVDPDVDDENLIHALLRIHSRRQMHDIWEKAKAGEVGVLTSEEQRIARVMMEHQEEFFNDFELADRTPDRIYDPETEANPFLHITIHTIVETQIAEKTPPEAFQFLNAMVKKKCPRHEAVHLIGAILAPLMFHCLVTEEPFEDQTYRDLLKKYKTQKPEKIWDLLEKEPRLYLDEGDA